MALATLRFRNAFQGDLDVIATPTPGWLSTFTTSRFATHLLFRSLGL